MVPSFQGSYSLTGEMGLVSTVVPDNSTNMNNVVIESHNI